MNRFMNRSIVMGHQAVIAYNKRDEPEPKGFDEYFAQLASENIPTVTTATILNMKH